MLSVTTGSASRKGGAFAVMTGNGDPAGKADVMKRREQAHTCEYLTVECICLCGMSIVTTQAFHRILFFPFASFSYPSSFYSNRVGSD